MVFKDSENGILNEKQKLVSTLTLTCVAFFQLASLRHSGTYYAFVDGRSSANQCSSTILMRKFKSTREAHTKMGYESVLLEMWARSAR
jgi:hypothetical protein